LRGEDPAREKLIIIQTGYTNGWSTRIQAIPVLPWNSSLSRMQKTLLSNPTKKTDPSLDQPFNEDSGID
jgi:hypothetical protein